MTHDMVALRKDGLISTGFFRTGSTFFFSCLRSSPSLRCFYEPYHPNILEHVRQLKSGITGPDKTYLNHTVDGDYFTEYDLVDFEGFAASLKSAARMTNHPVMAPNASKDWVGGYIDFLLENTRMAGKIPVLQCNRYNLILPWLRFRYPNYLIVLITRSPRAVFQSLAGLARKQGKSLSPGSVNENFWNITEIFTNIVVYYGIDQPEVWNMNYYQRLYFAMKFIDMFMAEHADLIVKHEHFTINPEGVVRRIGEALEIDAAPLLAFAKSTALSTAIYQAEADTILAKYEAFPNQVLQDYAYKTTLATS